MKANNLSLGRRGEEVARQHLERLGYKIIAVNYKIKLGEIDVIAEQGGDLVFVEVKTRSGHGFGTPAEAVTRRKQAQIIKVAQYYMASCHCHDRAARFDVVTVLFLSREQKTEIEVIRNAFELQ